MMSRKELKERTIDHPLSVFPIMMVIIFGICLIQFGIIPHYKNTRERSKRVEITGTISDASDTKRVTKKSLKFDRVWWAKYKDYYYQNFVVNYTYKDKEYSKKYSNFKVDTEIFALDEEFYYKDGDTLKVFVNPSDVKDIKIDKECVIETQGIKVIGVFLIINILIIIIPKPPMKETEESENNSES